MVSLRDRILDHFSEESMKDGQLWAEIAAAAIRKPEIGEAARQIGGDHRFPLGNDLRPRRGAASRTRAFAMLANARCLSCW